MTKTGTGEEQAGGQVSEGQLQRVVPEFCFVSVELDETCFTMRSQGE